MFGWFASLTPSLAIDTFLPNILTRSDSQEQSYPDEVSDELAQKKLKKIRATLQNLTEACREHNLKREHRDEIIDAQNDLLRTIVELVGTNRTVRHWPADNHPTLDQIADVFEEAIAHAHPEYAYNTRTLHVAEQVQHHAQRIYDELEQRPEYEYAYSEQFRKTVYNYEIQSFGIPHGIDEEEVSNANDAQEVYACGRATKAMEEMAPDPDSPLWLGVDTRSGKDVSLEKDVLFRHRAIFGQTGYGKSTLLMNDAKQLIESGAGICIIDPKGDDSRRLMQLIPEERMDDVLWIEPSASGDHLSGFNYITMGLDQNDPNYEVARANLVEDLKKMLKMSADYWGPRMDRVAMNLITAMNMYNDLTPDDAPEMNLVDLYYILKSEASRKEFSARCQKAGLRFVDDYTEEIAQMSDDDLEPLLGRFLPWIQNPVARRMIGFREGGINIPKAIENNRIIIVRMGQEPRELKQMLGMAVVRRIWSRIRSRAEQAAHSRKPFYLFADEFDNIALHDETIPSIISESRSYRLSLTIANQYPDQLPQNVINAITTNCDTIISFNPGDKKAANTYNTQLGLDTETLTDEVNYHVWLRTTVDQNMEKSEAFRTYVYPPHPPYRTINDAQTWIDRSLKRYGRERRSDEETYLNLLFNGGDGKWETGIGKEIEMAEEKDMVRGLEVQLEQEVPMPDDPAVGSGPTEAEDNPFGVPSDDSSSPVGSGQQSSDPVEKYRDEILETIFATALRLKDDPQAPVPTAEVKDRLVDRLPDDVGDSLSELSNLFEKLDGEYAETTRLSGEVNVQLTSPGEAEVFDADTGSAGSGGGDHHRWVLRECYAAFTKIGYETRRPHQEGDELPDGVAEPPVDIRDIDPELPPSKFTEEMENRKERLQTQYPEVWKFSQGDPVSIEAETSTVETPFQTFNNLIKSQKKGSLCVFALKDGTAKEGAFDYWGQRVEQAIYETIRKPGGETKIVSREPTFRKGRPSEDANPRYYTYSSGHYKLDEERTAIRPKTDAKRSVWYLDEETGEVVCAPSNGEQPIEDGDEIRFDNKAAVAEGDPTAVPAYYEYDQSNQQYLVNHNGEELKYNSKEELEADWEKFRGPFIPENEFTEMPTEDDFIHIIFPDANSEYDQPQIYEHGECRPLFDELGMEAGIPTGDDDIKHVDVEDIEANTTVDDENDDGEGTDTGTKEDTESDGKAHTDPDASEPTDEEAPTPPPEAETEAEPEADGEPNSTEDTTAQSEGQDRPPRNITPAEIKNDPAFDRARELSPGDIPSIASGMWLPEKGSDKYNQLVSCIGRIDDASAEYIDDPTDLPKVIGSPGNDQDTTTTAAADEQDQPEETGDATPEADNESTPEDTADPASSEQAESANDSEPAPDAVDTDTDTGESNATPEDTESNSQSPDDRGGTPEGEDTTPNPDGSDTESQPTPDETEPASTPSEEASSESDGTAENDATPEDTEANSQSPDDRDDEGKGEEPAPEGETPEGKQTSATTSTTSMDSNDTDTESSEATTTIPSEPLAKGHYEVYKRYCKIRAKDQVNVIAGKLDHYWFARSYIDARRHYLKYEAKEKVATERQIDEFADDMDSTTTPFEDYDGSVTETSTTDDPNTTPHVEDDTPTPLNDSVDDNETDTPSTTAEAAPNPNPTDDTSETHDADHTAENGTHDDKDTEDDPEETETDQSPTDDDTDDTESNESEPPELTPPSNWDTDDYDATGKNNPEPEQEPDREPTPKDTPEDTPEADPESTSEDDDTPSTNGTGTAENGDHVTNGDADDTNTPTDDAQSNDSVDDGVPEDDTDSDEVDQSTLTTESPDNTNSGNTDNDATPKDTTPEQPTPDTNGVDPNPVETDGAGADTNTDDTEDDTKPDPDTIESTDDTETQDGTDRRESAENESKEHTSPTESETDKDEQNDNEDNSDKGNDDDDEDTPDDIFFH